MPGNISRGRISTTVVLVLCNLAAVLLYVSWYRTQEISTVDGGQRVIRYAKEEHESVWKRIDYGTFKALNGSLRDRETAQTFWALTNNRATDLMSAACMALVMWCGLVVRKSPEEKLTYAKFGLFLGVMTILLDISLPLTLFDYGRPSASLEVREGIIRLSEMEHITWSFKESSSRSFPGDHGAILLACAIYVARFATLRWGIAAFLVAILFGLPRLVVGAHWATDILVGSTFVALISTSWVFWLSHRNIGPDYFHRLAVALMKLTGQTPPPEEKA